LLPQDEEAGRAVSVQIDEMCTSGEAGVWEKKDAPKGIQAEGEVHSMSGFGE